MCQRPLKAYDVTNRPLRAAVFIEIVNSMSSLQTAYIAYKLCIACT